MLRPAQSQHRPLPGWSPQRRRWLGTLEIKNGWGVPTQCSPSYVLIQSFWVGRARATFSPPRRSNPFSDCSKGPVSSSGYPREPLRGVPALGDQGQQRFSKFCLEPREMNPPVGSCGRWPRGWDIGGGAWESYVGVE